jgi:hypothetical protein
MAIAHRFQVPIVRPLDAGSLSMLRFAQPLPDRRTPTSGWPDVPLKEKNPVAENRSSTDESTRRDGRHVTP